MTRLLLLLGIISVFIAFKSSKIEIDDLIVNKTVNKSEIHSIKGNCVFVIQLSTSESDSLEKLDAEAYESFSENANNDAERILTIFEKQNIKNIWSDKRYISSSWNKKNYLIDTRLFDIAGKYCILFNEKKEPKLIQIELIDETTLTEYYK
jgi:hypothetical protein